jgi:hypothetical protein
VVELGGAVAVPGSGLALTVTCAPKKLSYGLGVLRNSSPSAIEVGGGGRWSA